MPRLPVLLSVLATLPFVALPLVGFSLDDSPPTPRPKVPVSTAGADVVGQRLPLEGLDAVLPTDLDGRSFDGHVTLVRWWTDTCPYCETSLPVIEKLQEKYRKQGFRTLAVYHPKPPRNVDHGDIVGWARTRKFQGPVALDPDWRTLKSFYLTQRRPATSVSFLLDRHGVVRYVHPGPTIAPGKPGYDDVVQAIEALLAEPVKER